MKNFLKIALWACCAVVCLIFANSCGKSTPADAAGVTRIGVSIPSADHGWTGGIVWWAQKAKAELEKANPGIVIEVVTAKDSTEQVNQIESLMATGIKALVVLPHEPGPLTNVCSQVRDNGIFLVVVDRNLTKPVQNITVAGDNPGFGRTCAEVLAKQLNYAGDIVIMEGVQCAVNTDRVNAFREVMAKYPNIKIMDSQPTNWDTAQALKVMESFLQKYPKIDAVWTGDDDVLLGALKAYKESGRKDVKCFIGGAGSKVVNKMVLDKDPLVPANVTYPPKMIYHGVEQAIRGLNSATPINGEVITIPADIITPENAADFYFPDSIY
jgi:ribose transport system substrate-binding protein